MLGCLHDSQVLSATAESGATLAHSVPCSPGSGRGTKLSAAGVCNTLSQTSEVRHNFDQVL